MVHFFLYLFKISFIFSGRVYKRNEQRISAGCETVKLDAPTQLIAKDFGNLEVQINVC
jgi:hypothetical protein